MASMTDIEGIVALLRSRVITPDEARLRLAEAHQGNSAGDRQGAQSAENSEACVFGVEVKVEGRAEPLSLEQGAPASLKKLTGLQTTRHDCSNTERIAIIGASGRYPGAGDLDGFWKNLSAGRNSIREIPPSRWNVNDYYDPRRNQSGKAYCKWLGYLEDADCFDPLFFGISPAEAESMDPQHRIALLEAYKAFANAGYSPRSLNKRKCGVYLGMMHSDYGAMFHRRIATMGASAATSKSAAIAAGRIAYYFNLKGPAIAIDTACSSSLVATHLACQALLNREVDMALAGGVTLYLSPESYIAMCSAGMLASDGQCKTFDNRADGFVPGEGAGALVLKRLSDAETDHDPIRAVILGSGVNQDGRTNGITAPSVTSQIELAREVYTRHRIHPESIQYVEMHGTGTKLGDPIELEALSTVFNEFTSERQFCAIGSVKSNIGHTSAAAGVAGIHKVMLCLEHSAIPPTLHFKEPNEHFAFDRSPFRVNTELLPWVTGRSGPRRAAVSAFGFSGTNAHLVLEEYRAADNSSASKATQQEKCLIVLSARSQEQLRALAGLLLRHLEEDDALDLRAVAYTLQMAREAMEFRCAFAAAGRQQVLDTLALVAKQGTAPGVCSGHAKEGRALIPTLDQDEDVDVLVRAWMDKGKLQKVAELWVRGMEIDWLGLYSLDRPRRIALPCYPFAKERYWLQEIDQAASATALSDGMLTDSLHPLVHRNVSTLACHAYSSVFTGKEFFLADHLVKQHRMMPGVAFLEMAVTAVRNALDVPAHASSSITLKHHVWIRPVLVEEKPLEMRIALYPQQDGEILYEIHEGCDREKPRTAVGLREPGYTVCARGRAMRRDSEVRPAFLEIDSIRRRCPRLIPGETCRQVFEQWQMHYGPAYQGLQSVHVSEAGEYQALARVELPDHLRDTFAGFTLHPSLMDAALQSIVALSLAGVSEADAALLDPVLAFSLEFYEQLDVCPAAAWCWTRQSAGGASRERHPGVQTRPNTFDVDVCDEHGRICIRVKGLRLAARDHGVLRSTARETRSSAECDAAAGALLLTPVWDVERDLPECQLPKENLLLVGDDQPFQHALQQANVQISVLCGRPGDTIEQMTAGFHAVDAAVSHIVWVVTEPSSDRATDSLLFGFRLLQAVLRGGAGNAGLRWTVITSKACGNGLVGDVSPSQAALHGLFGSLAKERPHWTVNLIDVDDVSRLPLSVLFSPPPPRRGDTTVYRDGQRRWQKVVPCRLAPPPASRFRKGGLYLVIGGAGRIGEALTEYLIRSYEARVIWLGRRERNAEIQAKIDRLAAFGVAPLYMRVDAADRLALKASVKEISTECGPIHGVILSSLVFAAENLCEMQEADFLARLAAKAGVSVAVAEVFSQAPLDFLLFFSSIAAFLRNSQQSHYAAGCAFADALAHNLRSRWNSPVKVMNWGYWEGVPYQTLDLAKATGAYLERMQQIGIGFIQPTEAMEAVELLLAGPLDQLLFVKTTKPDALEKMGFVLDSETIISQAGEGCGPEGDLPGVLALAPPGEAPPFTDARYRLLESFEDLSARILLGQLQSLGFATVSGVSVTQWMSQVGIAATWHRWMHATLVFLFARGPLSLVDHECRLHENSPQNVSHLWGEWENRKGEWLSDPSLRPRVPLAETTLRAIPEILRGQRKPTEVLFPNSSVDLVEPLYRDNPVSDYLNQHLAGIVYSFLQSQNHRMPGQMVQLMEVGAGTGSVSTAVLSKLNSLHDQIAVYRFTDVSKGFLQRAEERFGARHPYLSWQIFNMELDPATQGFREATHDVIIAANVLHTARDVRQVLRNLKGLLKSSGLLALVEISARSLFSHITFGLLDGWWAHEDDALRIPGSPAVSSDMWQKLLEEEGFHHTSFPTPRGQDLGQQIILAQSDGVIRRPARLSDLDSSLSSEKPPAKQPENSVQAAAVAGTVAQRPPLESVQDVIVDKLALCLRLKRNDIDSEEPFADYGLDSILGIRLVQDLNHELQLDLPVTSLFDYASVAKLADHILQLGGASLASRLTVKHGNAPAPAAPIAATHRVPPSRADFHELRSADSSHARQLSPTQPIAIIGMSGRYPKSANLDELWEHLAQGHELIDEISRWSAANPKGRRQVGGFLCDIDHFDPSFFNISGSEAACMDPQQRIFLEEAYKALEDAGYVGDAADGKRCGVYAGYNGGDYRQLLSGEIPAQAMWGIAPSVLSARIAYYLNMVGPAITIDSACSSSLVALHLASQALWSNETDMALAGGVSIYCTPSFYEAAARADMLSPSGHCYTFDARADGFVPGEGAGVVVLKRLSDALADRDHIYGVIRGSGINQDGTTNGITAPSARSQQRLEHSIYEKFAIHPEEIQMVEAHGTGTRLGDPIEFQAISKAFRRYTEKRQFCAIGSIKTNIGHTTAAAGVAGVLKVLLALRHRQIPPSLNFEQGNPHIQFADSPFYVNTALREWVANEQGLRCAAVSSFGMSGTNAHIVLEQPPPLRYLSPAQDYYLVALSARSSAQLRQVVERILAHCIANPEIDCGHLSFTLLLGRKHFDYRLAAIVRSTEDLVSQLQGWLIDKDSSAVLTRQGRRKDTAALSPEGRSGAQQNERLYDLSSNTEEKLLESGKMFVRGETFAWKELFTVGTYARIPLPTYPFARGRYWYAGDPAAGRPMHSTSAMHKGGTAPETVPVLHPFLHRNVSSLSEQRFVSHFSGRESLIADHVVQKRSLFPAVGYFEMVRAAVEQSTSLAEPAAEGGIAAVRLRNVVWATPLVVDPQRGVDVSIALYPSQTGKIHFEVFTQPAQATPSGPEDGSLAGRTVHAQGDVECFRAQTTTMDLAAVQSVPAARRMGSQECYELFRGRGLEYGPAYCGLKSVQAGVAPDGGQQVLAEVVLPECAEPNRNAYTLHPGIMEASLQGAIGLTANRGDLSAGQTAPAIPFALTELEILRPCSRRAWAYIRYSDGSSEHDKIRKVDVDLCDEKGQLFARLRGLTSRVLESDPGAKTLLFAPRWEKLSPAESSSFAAPPVDRWVVTISKDGARPGRHLSPAIPVSEKESAPDVRQIILHAQGNIEDRFESYAGQILQRIQQIARSSLENVTLLQIVVSLQEEDWLLMGLSGLLRTACLENPKIVPQFIVLPPEESGLEFHKQLESFTRWMNPLVLRYEEHSPMVLGFQEITPQPEVKVPWQRGGIYVITGGLGGLGLLVAREIAAHAADCVLVIMGRSAMNALIAGTIATLEQGFACVEYRQLDVCDGQAVDSVLAEVVARFGRIHGLLHCAGITRDNFLLNKTAEELHAVFAPKVKGLLNLDHATRDLPIDSFLLFSSVAGALGNHGQADYAAANAFMDAFAHYRNRLMLEAKRQGRTLSINWPLWADGGMKVDAATQDRLDQSGFVPLTTAQGMEALYQAMGSGLDQVLVLAGNPQTIRQKVISLAPREKAAGSMAAEPGTQSDSRGLLGKIESWLLQKVSQILEVQLPDLDPEAELSDFGFDSISLTHFSNALNKAWNLSLMPTLFFQHCTLRSLTNYLLQEHLAVMRSHFAPPEETTAAPAGTRMQPALPESIAAPRPRFLSAEPRPSVSKVTFASEPIAVIGMSGRFPQAPDLNAFWQNLLEGKDCTTEIPRSRWDWRAYYGDPHRESNKTKVNRGAFIEGIDQFDPLFFGISPRDAALMDPQQRLTMTWVWKAIEDAGYAPASLSGTRTAVLIGTAGSDYNWLLAQENDAYSATGIAPSVGPNRVSYFLNLHGPSEPIETACSSSLVAIHRGMALVAGGQCEMAIVGGVNTVISPRTHVSFSKAGMLSNDGRCKTFSEAANGYGRGEGVGILLLKRLSAAERDNDHIYGVLRGSAENHGGRSNSLTAPNPAAQAEVIKDAHIAAGIDPRTVGYIEAHGTGTTLGDPIEMNGLKSAFEQLHHTWRVPQAAAASCAVGSVKTNIGHLELAAGVAGVIKVLLQLRHKTIVRSVNTDPINPYIELGGSPFYIVQQNRPWVALSDENGAILPRRAGVSSFGFGGVNSHVVLEEYIAPPKSRHVGSAPARSSALIVLSAKSADALNFQAIQLMQILPGLEENDLASLEYTLQVGRDAMSHRLAFVARSLADIEEKLQLFLADAANVPDLYRGLVRSGQDAMPSVFRDEDMRHTLELWMEKGKWSQLLELWVQGVECKWEKLHQGQPRRRLALPTYPFATDRYWIPKAPAHRSDVEARESARESDDAFLNDLLDGVIHNDAITLQAAATDILEAMTHTSNGRSRP